MRKYLFVLMALFYTGLHAQAFDFNCNLPTSEIDYDATGVYIEFEGETTQVVADFVDGIFIGTRQAHLPDAGSFDVFDAIYPQGSLLASGTYAKRNGGAEIVYTITEANGELPSDDYTTNASYDITFEGDHYNAENGWYEAYYGETVTIKAVGSDSACHSSTELCSADLNVAFVEVINPYTGIDNPIPGNITDRSIATFVAERTQTSPGNEGENAWIVYTAKVEGAVDGWTYRTTAIRWTVDPDLDIWDWYVDGNFQRNRVNGYYYSTRARFVGNDRDDMFTVYNPDGVQIFTSDWYDTSLEAVEAAEEYIETNFPD